MKTLADWSWQPWKYELRGTGARKWRKQCACSLQAPCARHTIDRTPRLPAPAWHRRAAMLRKRGLPVADVATICVARYSVPQERVRRFVLGLH